jgi:2-polyprenyl-3-methyl-5-hydroxy-6-metoxy-1,4-benzoquinol methylase/RNase P subunit RPR2
MERVDQLVSGFLKRQYGLPISRILSKFRSSLLGDVEHVACNLCGSNSTIEVAHRDKYGLAVTSVMCRNCGLMYLNPRPSRNGYHGFYLQGGDKEGVYHVSTTLKDVEPLLQRHFGPDFRMSHEDRAALAAYVREKFEQHVGAVPEGRSERALVEELESKAKEYEAEEYENYGDDIYAFFNRFVPRGGKVLEMGAAWGKLLVPWRDRHGCEVTGVEPRARTVQAAKERLGIDLFQGFPDTAKVPEQAYDAVFVIRTINHMLDPLGDLRHAWRWLKPGGIIGIDISDVVREARYEGFEKTVVEIDHPYMFTINSLAALLQQAGFEIVHREIVSTRHLLGRSQAPPEYKQMRLVGRKSLAPVAVSLPNPLDELSSLLNETFARVAERESKQAPETKKVSKDKPAKRAKEDKPERPGTEKPKPALLERARRRVRALFVAAPDKTKTKDRKGAADAKRARKEKKRSK